MRVSLDHRISRRWPRLVRVSLLIFPCSYHTHANGLSFRSLFLFLSLSLSQYARCVVCSFAILCLHVYHYIGSLTARRRCSFVVHTNLAKDVVVLNLAPGFDDAILEAIAKSGRLRGLVMQMYGTGNAPAAKSAFIHSYVCVLCSPLSVVLGLLCERLCVGWSSPFPHTYEPNCYLWVACTSVCLSVLCCAVFACERAVSQLSSQRSVCAASFSSARMQQVRRPTDTYEPSTLPRTSPSFCVCFPVLPLLVAHLICCCCLLRSARRATGKSRCDHEPYGMRLR